MFTHQGGHRCTEIHWKEKRGEERSIDGLFMTKLSQSRVSGAVSCVTDRVHCMVDSQKILESLFFIFHDLGLNFVLQNSTGNSPTAPL